MGTTQSYLSPEVLVTATVVAGAVGFGYSQIVASGNSSSKGPSTASVVSGKKGKSKKTDSAASGISTSITGAKPPGNVSVVPFPAVIPGQFDNDAPETSAGSGGEGASKTRKSKKKKAGKAPETQQTVTAPVDEPIISPAASVTFPESSTAPLTAKASTKSKKRKTQVPSQIPAKPTASSTSAKSDSHSQQLQKSTASLASYATESDGEWTRVSRRADKIRTSSTTEGLSDIGQTTTSATTGTSSPIDTRTEEGEEEEEEEDAIASGPGERHPLAKKLLPKPRKTGVEDMLGTSDYPSYSRVMRVQPGEKPAAGFSWGDYEDVAGDNPNGELDGDGGADADGEDDGWGVVKRGGRPKTKISSSPQSVSTSRIASASETMTKRQRQNAAKREAEKSAKQEAEQVRLATLAKHKREQERVRMDAQHGAK